MSAAENKSQRSARAGCRGTARLPRDIVPSTRLAREGRMTVTIGRRELLVALGGAAVARPLTARAAVRQAATIGRCKHMSDANRLLFLRVALIVIGLIFIFGIYTLGGLWPSGWAWGQGHSHYLMMIIG